MPRTPSPRTLALAALTVVVLTLAAVLFLPTTQMPDTSTAGGTTRPTTQPLTNRFTTHVDRVRHFASASDFSAGELKAARVEGGTVVLAQPDAVYPRVGVWTSPEIPADFPLTELVPTFNLTAPDTTGGVLEARVKLATGWSPWLYFQAWGKTFTRPDRTIKLDGGTLAIDELELQTPATAYQLRVTLHAFNFDPAINPVLRRVSALYSGPVADDNQRARLTPTQLPSFGPVDLPVPFRAQGDPALPKALWPEICSPTSTTMVLAHLGADLPTLDNALAIYDPNYDLFGNWGRAVSFAGSLGFDAWLENFRTLDQAHATLASGQPLIASIRFRQGDVTGFPYEKTAGHLIVIKGVTPAGDFILNDPASREKGAGWVVPRAQLERAWLYHGGLAYIIRKPAAPSSTVAPATRPTP